MRSTPADHKADPVEFAHKLADYLKGSRIERIAYWGGEPMLYWDRIKALHGALIDKGIRPEQSTVTTNGRSLTDDYVEYANANPDIFTVVSWHDGNFTDEQLSRIFRLREFSIFLADSPLSNRYVGCERPLLQLAGKMRSLSESRSALLTSQ